MIYFVINIVVLLIYDNTYFSVYVPESCCVDGESRILCQGDNDKYDGPPVYGPPNHENRIHKDNPALHTTVCIIAS